MRSLIFITGATLILASCGDIKTGPMGPPGPGCTVTQLANGAQISCPDGSIAVVSNGVDGQDAVLPPGYTYIPEGAFYISQIEDLCGNGAQEVLFRLNTGELIAHYSHGSKQYLTILGPGSYVTSDGYNCNFTIGSGPGYVLSY